MSQLLGLADPRRSSALRLGTMDVAKFQSVAANPFPFGLVRRVDFFAATQLAGHVRLAVVELTEHPQFSNEEILAWIMRQGDWHYQPRWRDELRLIRFTLVGQRDLTKAVEEAVLNVRDSDYGTNLEFPKSQIDVSVCSAAYRIEGMNLYAAGPTYMHCWNTGSQFGYIEIHLES